MTLVVQRILNGFPELERSGLHMLTQQESSLWGGLKRSGRSASSS